LFVLLNDKATRFSPLPTSFFPNLFRQSYPIFAAITLPRYCNDLYWMWGGIWQRAQESPGV
ncbi:MAG TPA: hypothetical protein VH164_13430, partial [Ktedonobacteraceae bacterium]|nr:hypothetical protein [Ktedonobacteraceae bacterium]